LGKNAEVVDKTAFKIQSEKIVERIWRKDHTIWNDDPSEISNRLGWLNCIEITSKSFDEINSFVEEVKSEGFTHALLLGMGGSSLAPEVFRLTFGFKDGYLDLSVLDSTHPGAVLEYSRKLDPTKTLYIVSTKSGGTIETISFMKYFYTGAVKKLGKGNAGAHFIAITDPGSGLESIAKKLNFRKIFLNDPNIGGRFSALSLFGTVPAALIGIDLEKLFSMAEKIIEKSKNKDLHENSSAMLGAVIGSLANEEVDKLTFIISPQIRYLGGWLEQLIAESTGKNGKGILPVDLEPFDSIDQYSKDRVFFYLKFKVDSYYDEHFTAIKNAGFPTIEIELNDVYDLGGEFFRWEFATAVAGYVMKVQPFDQPNVESAKVAARNMMKDYNEKGKLPDLKPTFERESIKVYGDVAGDSLDTLLSSFLSKSTSGKNYISIQAYLKPKEKIWQLLQLLRSKIFKKYNIVTTLGYGPRFLHSTGQLHKGDGGNGLFIQLVADSSEDANIPENAGDENSLFSFGVLIDAQALGDRQALIENGRKVIQFHLGGNITDGINKLANLI
jgi:glucose-6-phosphate isomerase